MEDVSDICTMLGPVRSSRQVLFQPVCYSLSAVQRQAVRLAALSTQSVVRHCPGAHSSSLGNPKAQVAGCSWLLRPFLFCKHRDGCCHGHPAFTSFCPQVVVLNTASTPRGPCSGLEGTALFSDPETTRNRMAVISPSA